MILFSTQSEKFFKVKGFVVYFCSCAYLSKRISTSLYFSFLVSEFFDIYGYYHMGIFVTRSDYLNKSLQVVNWGYYCKQRSKCSNSVKDINTHMDAHFYIISISKSNN